MLTKIRPVLVVVALLAALSASACGGRVEDEEQVASLTAEQVSAEFREQTGKGVLRKAAGDDPAWVQLHLGLDPPAALVSQYGVFSIYVVKPGRSEATRSLLRDKTTGKPLERDERGIYWEYDPASRTWIANTRYGSNVVLVWFSGRKERRTDARWERLDAILTALDQP